MNEKRAELKQETSCGAIVKDNGKILLVQQKNGGHWSFPKGHMELNETKQETAEREVLEETGIRIKIVSDREYKYTFILNECIQKTVFFYEAVKIAGEIEKQESEITNVAWVPYDEVIDKLVYEQPKIIFKEFLKNNGIENL